MAHITDQTNTAFADRYVIERELGAGGMATVHLEHDRKVALKLLHSELAAVIGAGRFLAEIEVTANLRVSRFTFSRKHPWSTLPIN